MGKFDGYLIMSDFDGTLAHGEVDENGTHYTTVSRENCDAIRYFQSEGGLFTLATGRRVDMVRELNKFFVPNTYVSTFNGALVCSLDGSDVLFSGPMRPDFVDVANRVRAACPKLEWILFHQLHESVRVLPDDPIPSTLFPEPVYKMVCYAHRADSDEYAARVASVIGNDYLSMRSWINGIEIQQRGTGKGDTVRRLKERLGDRARVVISVGDYENDVDMLRAADIGYAVSNAALPALAAADRITVSNRDSAIARIIEEIV